MSTVSRAQNLLGAIATARVGHHPVQMISPKLSSEPVAAPPVQTAPSAEAIPPAWDPHEVWLNRVKKPREQRSV